MIILAICIVSEWYISSNAAKVTSALAPIEISIDQKAWGKAKNDYNKVLNLWHNQLKIWKILVNHDEMGDIEIGFVEVGLLLDQHNTQETKKELAALIFYLEHVPENEKLDLSNLF